MEFAIVINGRCEESEACGEFNLSSREAFSSVIAPEAQLDYWPISDTFTTTMKRV